MSMSAAIEDGFSDIVHTLQPTKDLFDIAKAMFKDAWDQRGAQAAILVVTLKQEVKALEKQMENLLERIMDASNSTVITAYEAKIEKLERERLLMT